MESTICYEQPLNERARLFLRLEFLFDQFEEAAAGDSARDSRYALQALLEILDLTIRGELKSELRKEMERETASLNRLRRKHTAGLDTSLLESILDKLQRAAHGVNTADNYSLEKIRKHDFISAIRQRSSIPGGCCQFDLPALHHWLQTDSAIRNQHLQEWFQAFRPLCNATRLLLQLMRESAVPSRETAIDGFFQKALDSNTPNQLVRVILPKNVPYYPEISGGKHRFSIRFMIQTTPDEKAVRSKENIDFLLVCCMI